MASPGVPNNFTIQSANQQILASWSLSAGADSYELQRSEDNVTYTLLATITGSPLATQHLDTSAVLGTQYYYKVQALTGVDASGFTLPASGVSTPTGEMCLSQIRLAAQQRADRVNSNFVTNPEWRNYINQAMFELYDLLITVYEDYYIAPPIQFIANGNQFLFPLPNGSNTFQDALNPNVTITPRPFYKLSGIDLALNTAPNAYVTLKKFNFIDRNSFVYPTSGGSLFGIFNPEYRIMGQNVQMIPTPSASQTFRMWYIPRLKELLLETDTTDTGISGWIEYVIVRAAKYALDKEESDSSVLTQEIAFLKTRIEESAVNRDAGMPDSISEVRRSGSGNGWNGGWGFGSTGGW